MPTIQTLESFYSDKLSWIPENLQREIGHFNVFNREIFNGPKAKPPVPYSRRNYYKISLMIGKNRFHYADKSMEIDTNALLFSNPQVPYQCEPQEGLQSGFFCIFTEAFMNEYSSARLQEFPVFRPGGQPIYVLNEDQVETVYGIFTRMMAEMGSEYAYKYDALRNYVFELIHLAQKMEPVSTIYQHTNASTRISTLFVELLERQFPVETPRQQVKLRKASDFAGQLSVHVNHLNRALKEVTGKTTTVLIAERLVQEAKALLKHTDWNISEVAYGLGFEEPAHFNNFFKKHTRLKPSEFRS
jgi:AraC family transcriptional regulator, transcriptional activator of pobA